MAAPCPLGRHAWVETKYRPRPLASESNGSPSCSQGLTLVLKASKPQPNSRHQLLPRPTSAAHRLTELIGRMSPPVISCCSLKNIGTRLVLKNFLTAPIRDNNELERQLASTVHYCTLSRIMLFLRHCVFPSSASLGQSPSLQQKSAFGKSCVRCEIVS
jgi:hypothetical protein